MIKQSDIANFIDLIKHISEIKAPNNRLSRTRKPRNRYPSHEQNPHHELNHHSHPSNPPNDSHASSYDHKKLRTHMGTKKHHMSFKLDSISCHTNSEIGILADHTSAPRDRKNLYEMYCEEIQRKRHSRKPRDIRELQKWRGNGKRNWEQTAPASIDQSQESINWQQEGNLHKDKSLPTSPKSKALKAQEEGVRNRKKKCKLQAIEHIHPSELNIAAFGKLRMPRISHISELRNPSKISYNTDMFGKTKARINRGGEITAWAQEQEPSKFFNGDLF